MALTILCDFDGTISSIDTSNVIFERFAPGWEHSQAAWEAGEIGSAECMRLQVELIDASLAELDEALDEFTIDPAFPAFACFCTAAGFKLTVVSDGVDYFVHRILRREGLAWLPVRANHMILRGERRYSLSHPHRVAGCEANAGTCKCACVTEGCASQRTVLIGDGRSDFCVAQKAGIVFAKGSLLAYAREQGIKVFEYATFKDVAAALEKGFVPACNQHPVFANAGLEAA